MVEPQDGGPTLSRVESSAPPANLSNADRARLAGLYDPGDAPAPVPIPGIGVGLRFNVAAAGATDRLSEPLAVRSLGPDEIPSAGRRGRSKRPSRESSSRRAMLLTR